jgi:hypothetical protein
MDMNKFKAINPNELIAHASSSTSKMIKTASAVAEAPQLVLNDPFKLDEKITGTYD